MIPLPSDETTPPVTKMYFVSATLIDDNKIIYNKVQIYNKLPNVANSFRFYLF